MSEAGKTVAVNSHRRRCPGRRSGVDPRQPGAHDGGDAPARGMVHPSFQALLGATRLIQVDIAFGEGVLVPAARDTRVVDVCMHPTVLSRLWVHGPKYIRRSNGMSIPLFTVHWSGAHDEVLMKSAQVKDVLSHTWDAGWHCPSIRWVLRPAWRGGRAEMGEFKMALYQAYATQHGYTPGWAPTPPPTVNGHGF